MEEAGSKVAHRRKKGDRQPEVMQVDLAAFEASADGNKYCLVAAVTIETDKESKLLPIFVPLQPSKKLYLSVKTAIYIKSPALDYCEFMQTEEENLAIRSSKIYAGRRTLFCLSLQHINHASSNGTAERMIGILKSTVRRMLKQAHLEREWWSHARRHRSHDDRESSRTTTAISSLRATCGNVEVSQ